MLKRKFYGQLLSWKHTQQTKHGRKALLVMGARQVGKSYLIRHFAQKEYKAYLEINLAQNKLALKSLSSATNVKDFISRVTLLSQRQLVPGKSLIFIDEIQENPDLITMAKFLVEDGRFDWAFSGSMLGTQFKGIRSFPVGYVSEHTMHPLDFEEFLWALNISQNVIEEIRNAFSVAQPVADYIHEAMLTNYRIYICTGGMPEVINTYLDHPGDFGFVRELQAALNEQYRFDIAKYAGGRSLMVQEVFDQLPLQLREDKKHFVVKELGNNSRYATYAKDIAWLTNAGVALKTEAVTEPKYPLLRTHRPSLFKLYQSDTGMLLERFPRALMHDIYADAKSPNTGVIYENALAQALSSLDQKLYFYNVRKQGEVDFLVEDDRGGVIPLEVKSGAYYKSHAALDKLLSQKTRDFKQAFVFCKSNVMKAGILTYVPFYMCMCLPQLLHANEDDLHMKPVII